MLALLSAASMLILREPMRVALALITSMTSLAAVYGLMGVHFIAAFQVLIYVGAVMVFMVYVIMLLQLRESPNADRWSALRWPGVLVAGLLLAVLAVVARGVDADRMPRAPLGQSFTLVEFSTDFLSRYWLEFELTTVFLVGAIVAALAVIGVSRRQGAASGASVETGAERQHG
ncbi:MAG: NADH-quinone oxidoreductase subunit J [Gemmatimonadaceae bacterium]|nr:NADH-quinone oxidoreductase subunit J [Gemmatimonadaceae bacterium]